MLNIFHITILSLSCFYFITVPPKSNKSLARIYLTTFFTAKAVVDQAFIIAVKFRVDFVTFLAVKLSNVSVTFMFLQT